LFADLRDDLRSFGAELREMAAARWELARLELLAQRKVFGNLAGALIAAMLMALTALPLLAWCLADALDGWYGVSRGLWLFGFAIGLLITALSSGYLAIRRFRRHATGLQETIEELREDLVWLRDWTSSGPRKGEPQQERPPVE
jgi:uncharacterized membrane protein YqjE